MRFVQAITLLCLAGAARAQDSVQSVSYAADIEPILRARCYKCHGPDTQKAGLRLDQPGPALRGSEFGPVIIPGNSEASILIHNVERRPDSTPMPAEGEALSPEQIALLRRWIDEGAPWPNPEAAAMKAGRANRSDRGPISDHWAYQRLAHPTVPNNSQSTWIRNPIDAFVLRGLKARDLSPSAEADRRTLIRRLTYNMHGLPPTPEEIEAFINDPADDAYDSLIERLLASPRYGERWGRHWLDVAHYGETHGYDKDHRRDNAWPYRDYVIRAFNADKPYAQFVREQLAGDVINPLDPEGIVATGFIVAGPWDQVGQAEVREGTIEKKRVRLLDRDDMVMNAVSTFTSATVHCARCHDHKFDPIPQRDYYRLQAVFAGIDRADREFEDPEFARFRASLRARRVRAKSRSDQVAAQIEESKSEPLKAIEKRIEEDKKRLARLARKQSGGSSPSNGFHSVVSDIPDVTEWVQVDLGARSKLDKIRLIPARPTDFDDTPGFGFPVRFAVSVSDDPEFETEQVVADHRDADFENPGAEAFEVALGGLSARYIRVTATKLWKRSGDYVFALAELEALDRGRNRARGKPVAASSSIDYGRWSKRFLVDGHDSRSRLGEPTAFADAVIADFAKRLEGKVERLETERAEIYARDIDPDLANSSRELEAKLAQADRWLKSLPPADRVYAAKPVKPREVHLLRRGDVTTPGALAAPGALTLLPWLDSSIASADESGEGAARAALAEWIVDPANSLTWRSIVNRVWHYHFGRGIVDTPNDFGANGSSPTHPELLDWLAAEFREGGGSIKDLHRLILTSATYRQSSAWDAAKAAIDGSNQYLWRMNRRRLEAEAIRDAMLSISGEIDLTMGGPSFPLFSYTHDHSPRYEYVGFPTSDQRRRSVYRFIVRSVADPFFEALDCADPNINTPARSETLTPQQALVLYNDAFVLNQSEAFAERLRKMEPNEANRIDLAFSIALSRSPSADERDEWAAYASEHGLESAARLLFNTNEFIFVD